MSLVISDTLTEASQERDRNTGIIWLFEVEQRSPIGGFHRRAIWPEAVTYDLADDRGLGPVVWEPIGATLTEESEADGVLSPFSMTLSNIDRLISRKFENDLLRDQPIALYIVDTGSLDVAGHHQTQRYYIGNATAGNEVISIELVTADLMSVVFPRYTYREDRCTHIYEGGTHPTVDGRCAAVDASETCDKSYDLSTGCLGRNNQARFGAFVNMVGKNDTLIG